MSDADNRDLEIQVRDAEIALLKAQLALAARNSRAATADALSGDNPDRVITFAKDGRPMPFRAYHRYYSDGTEIIPRCRLAAAYLGSYATRVEANWAVAKRNADAPVKV